MPALPSIPLLDLLLLFPEVEQEWIKTSVNKAPSIGEMPAAAPPAVSDFSQSLVKISHGCKVHCNSQVIEADKEWLKKSASEARAVKMSLLQQHHPQLVSDFLLKQKSGAAKQIQTNRKKADAKVKPAASQCLAWHA